VGYLGSLHTSQQTQQDRAAVITQLTAIANRVEALLTGLQHFATASFDIEQLSRVVRAEVQNHVPRQLTNDASPSIITMEDINNRLTFLSDQMANDAINQVNVRKAEAEANLRDAEAERNQSAAVADNLQELNAAVMDEHQTIHSA
jgi:hypothetical protein